jgi:hypothetical protein
VEEPLHEQRAADTERILPVLIWPGTEPIEGHRKALDTESGH